MSKSSKSGPGPTGPRTPRGKARSSQNSTKHGLFSERVSPAEEKEAARLHRVLRKDLHLRGFEDEFFGSDLVLTTLKKTRLDKYTRDELRKADMQAARDRKRRFEFRLSLKRDSPSSPNRVHPDLAVIFLKKLKTDIEGGGLNPEEDLPILYSLFASDDGQLTALGYSIILPFEIMKQAGSNPDGKSADLSEERQARVLAGIEDAIKIEQLSARSEAVNDRAELRDVSAVLPDAVADRILRSETAIVGHILRLLHGLEYYRRLRAAG
jgi:hypothetical protein